MLFPIAVALQAATPAAAATETRPQAEPCRKSSTNGEDEILVCARREGPSRYRIAPQPPAASELPKAEFKLFGILPMKVHAEQGEVGGIPTNRATVSIKIGF